MCCSSDCAASFLWSGQSAASPGKAPGVGGECNVSCAYAVRGCIDPVAGACCRSHLQNYHGIMLFRTYERVVWASRFRGPGMAIRECWGAPLHQLVHNPKTGDATGSCSLAGVFSFFFVLYCTTSGPGGKVTSSHAGSLPLRVPSRGGTTGWFVPAFAPACIPSSLRPLLSRPVVRVVWMFPWPLVCQLFLLLGLFAGMVFCKFLPHSSRGADLVEVVVDSLEEVSRGKLFSLLAPVGRFDWPPFDIYEP